MLRFRVSLFILHGVQRGGSLCILEHDSSEIPPHTSFHASAIRAYGDEEADQQLGFKCGSMSHEISKTLGAPIVI